MIELSEIVQKSFDLKTLMAIRCLEFLSLMSCKTSK